MNAITFPAITHNLRRMLHKVDTTYPALSLLENLGYVFFNPQVTSGQLTLTPITLETRKQNVKLINLLALHSSKLADVQKIWPTEG